MPTPFRYLAACALSVLLAVPPARACGDKMLIIGHDLRMQIRSASVISYAPPGSPFSAVANNAAFRTAAQKTVREVRIIEDEGTLRAALRSGKYDVVIADLSEAARIVEILRDAQARTVVLPVVLDGTKAQLQAAEKQFHCVLKAPGKVGNYVDAIEWSMEVKSKRKQWSKNTSRS
jgi:hypothetical protein